MAAPTVRVLVVDDDRDTVDTTSFVIEAWGYQPLLAYDPETALTLASEHRPEAVLLDLAMPGMDGYTLASRLRRLPGMEKALLICVSGYLEDANRARQAGCDRHFLKPAPLDELARMLARLGDSASGAQSGSC